MVVTKRRTYLTRQSSMHILRTLVNVFLLSCATLLYFSSIVATAWIPATFLVQNTFHHAKISFLFSSCLRHNAKQERGKKMTEINSKNAASDVEGQIDLGLQKARAVLQKSKAKLAAIREKEDGICESKNDLPYFAHTVQKTVVSRDGVVKSINEETGLVRADGERMAEISELEDWEFRSLFDVFENEMTEDEDRYSIVSQQLASRDVAASVFNLRKELETDDYRRIFDTNNRFIGEDN
jgi:hypothetical protein